MPSLCRVSVELTVLRATEHRVLLRKASGFPTFDADIKFVVFCSSMLLGERKLAVAGDPGLEMSR